MQAPSSETPSPEERAAFTVLVVDDDEIKRYATCRVLRHAGFAVKEAKSGFEALTVARSLPDLVLVDVRLPDLNGFEVCHRLKTDPATSRIPVVHLSAMYVADEHRARGLTEGADGYLLVPVDSRVLVATVHSWQRFRKLEREREHLLLAERHARALAERSEQRFRFLTATIPQMVWTTHAGGEADFFNKRWLEYTGLTLEQSVGFGWTEVIHPDDRPASGEAWARALREKAFFRVEYRLRGADGTYRWHLGQAQPMLDEQGGVLRWFGTSTDIQSQKEAEENYERIARTREQFMAILGHDLRNPLSAVSMAAQLLQQADDLPPHHQKAVARLSSSAHRMGRMISDLLDFTRVRLGGQLPVQPRPCDLREIVGAVVQEFEVTHPGRTLRLSAAAPVTGTWDPDRIAQAVTNLIGNALQHAHPADAPIDVAVATDAGHALVSVSNHTPRLPAELLPQLFEPFRRGEGAENPKGSSVGLGLYIALNIVRAHGGEIDVRSEEDRTTFTVRLPR